MINRKQAALLVCVAFLFAAVFWGHMSAGAGQEGIGPGSEGDPLVSKSYVDEKVDRLQTEISALEEKLTGIQGFIGFEESTVAEGLAEGGKAVVSPGSGGILRSGPGKAFKQLGGLKKGVPVEILEIRGGWCRVKTGPDGSGWIFGELLKVEP